MIRSGYVQIRRLMAFLLMLCLLPVGVTPAGAADFWEDTILNLVWTDHQGNLQTVQAMPVANHSDRAYWAQLDASALEGEVTLEVTCPDPAYTFYLEDGQGNRTNSFRWLSEMDARSLAYEEAHVVFYAVDGVQAYETILLYLSSQPLPEESVPESYPVEIPVYYMTEDGTVLDVQYVECWTGESNTIWAGSAKTQDYALVGRDTAEVFVDVNGVATPAEVTFTYRQLATPTPDPTDVPTPTPVAEVSIPVVYVHVNGQQLDFQEIFLAPGTHVVEASSARVAGYVPAGDTSVRITVYPDGTTDLASVTFYYEDPQPAEAVIPVYYYHVDGTLLDVQEKTLSAGSHTIHANSDKTGGLVLEGASSANVTVYPDGSADTAYVAFTYADPVHEPVQVRALVQYIHVERGVLDTQEILLTEGTQIVRAQSDRTADYLPVGSTSVEVTVYPDGTIHPGSIEFYYEDAYTAPVTVDVEILYCLPDNTVAARDVVSLAPGRHTLVADAAKTGGYPLAGEQSQVVEVYDNGLYSPDAPVTFHVRYPDASVYVHYQDDMGRAVAPDQKHTFSQDGDYVIEAAPENLDASYELAPGLHTAVTVSVRAGVPSQQDVYFYYQKRQAEVQSAMVTVHYYDTEGNEIAPAQTVRLEAGEHSLRPEPVGLPQGYELASDEAVTVHVYENGTFSPQEVAFYYRAPQEKMAVITIYFRDDRGNNVASTQTVRLPDGKHVIQARPDDLPDGYEIFSQTGDTAEVTVRNGVASQSQVVFYYLKTETQSKEFRLPVSYYDTEGRLIASTQYVEVPAGAYAITANPTDLPEGYELAMEETLSVTVFADGTTEPEEIAFYYRPTQLRAQVIVRYVDESGHLIAEAFTVELGSGTHTIEADDSRVPQGYDPRSAKPVQVYVSKDGRAQPDEVVLVFTRQAVETPIPVGAEVNRYATVKSADVAFRNEPTTSGGNRTVIKRLSKNSRVFVYQEMYNDQNEIWAMVNVDGRIGYMMSSYLDILTQQQSDAYAASGTQVPTFTPVPTPTEAPTPTASPTQAPATATPPLVEIVSPAPSASPSLEPLPADSPTPTASPEPYTGYALTTRATALRTGVSSSDMTIIQMLEANELVYVADQVTNPSTGESWAIVSTLSEQPGYVRYDDLRNVTDREAAPYLEYWKEVNKTAEPTELATASPEPPQLVGYGVVIGDGVPLRQMQSELSRIIDNLEAGTVVYITGQTLGDGQYWHSVNYENRWGYIRSDLVRMMTVAEEEEYLASQQATPTPATSNLPFDAQGLSSYGYVDASSVNWRQGPSVKSKNVEGRSELKRYAFCLVLGSEYVNGVTWYKVSYGDKTGYVHGDYFHQMTISELEDFLGSDEYLQGVTNNSTSGTDAKDDVGFTGTGGIVSAEDQWVNNNPDAYASFAPFNPIGTVAPIATATPTLEPLPGWYTSEPTATPTPTATFNPLPDVTYPTTDDGNGGSAVLWAVVAGLLILVVGGVFALVRYNQNRRRIALRAAQRRAQAARMQQQQQQQQRPYARAAASGQPRTGMYQQQPSVRRPVSGQGTEEAASRYAPYTEASYPHSFRRPEEETANEAPQRVGRRTAYRQAQEAFRRAQENDDQMNQ